MKRKPRRLFTILVAVFILISMLPAVLLGQTVLSFSNRYLSETLREEGANQSRNMALELSRYLREYSSAAASIAEDEALAAWVAQEDPDAPVRAICAEYAYDFRRKNGQELTFHLVSSNGAVQFSTGSIPNLYKMPVYQSYGVFRKAMDQKGETVFYANRFPNYKGDYTVLSVCHTITGSDGQVAGFVVLDVLRKDLQAFLNQFQSSYSADNLVIDGSRITVLDTALSSDTPEGLRLTVPLYTRYLISSSFGSPVFLEADSLLIGLPVEGTDLTLLRHLTFPHVRQLAGAVSSATVVILAASLLLTVFLAFFLASWVVRPFQRLISSFSYAKQGNFDHRFTLSRHDYREIAQLSTQYNDMVEKIQELMVTNVEKQRLLNIAEMNALQSQIKPHFFYNFLNDIKSLAKLNRNSDICRLVVLFGSVLRGCMEEGGEYTDIQKDILLIRNYLDMQNILHDGGIRKKILVDPALLPLQIPRFILQPLVENAVVHGLQAKAGGCVLVRGRLEGGRILFTVADNGVGFSASQGRSRESGSLHPGIGIENINRRLRLYYGASYGIKIESRAGFYTKITVEFRRMDP
ncbi:MAG TPA: histidine kinase [Candidatus Caccousia avistercoris]|nr:histidine kinase [Candidatus Caccousia avistercoris]